MKRVIFATVTATTVFMSALPVASTEFRGAFCISTANAACKAQGWDKGWCPFFRYSPPNVGNGVRTEISIFDDGFSTGYVLNNGSLVGTAYKPVTAIKVARGGYTYSSTMRITSQVPRTPLATTPFINLSGNISNWDEIAGCVVGFRATATPVP